MSNKKERKVNYGNWVPATMMYLLTAIMVVLFGVVLLNMIFWKITALGVIVGVLFLAVLAYAVYMGLCRREFDFTGGGLMGKIHEYLVLHLPWDGRGTLLDIGCGAGALTIRCAKRFPKARLVGMDYWGAEWNYAKEQCESNALAEGVSGRIKFEKGDAAKLSYPSEFFDAAVSNFVFHEVRTQPDKRKVVREALRVVKKGGSFSFQDLFAQKQLYGNMEEFIEELKKEGIQEIHYIPNVEKQGFIPGFVQAPWMLSGIGLIYGRK